MTQRHNRCLTGTMVIMSVGHSTHTAEKFLQIAKAARLTAVIDVRSHRSSRWEQWHGEQMDRWLPAAGIESISMPSLGGWNVRHEPLADWAAQRGVDLSQYIRGHFPKQRIGKATDESGVPPQYRGWTNQGLHDYSWFTVIKEFQEGLSLLIERYGSRDQPRVALMCGELLWWKCHRSMIADVLFTRSVPVYHLTPGPDRVRYVRHEPLATDRLQRYPLAVRQMWERHDWKEIPA